jgi:hypothetical protein
MIGYHLAWENSLIGMVMVQGKQREVVNIGLGIKQVAVEPRDATVSTYVESLSHKVCGTRSPPPLPPRGCLGVGESSVRGGVHNSLVPIPTPPHTHPFTPHHNHQTMTFD